MLRQRQQLSAAACVSRYIITKGLRRCTLTRHRPAVDARWWFRGATEGSRSQNTSGVALVDTMDIMVRNSDWWLLTPTGVLAVQF